MAKGSPTSFGLLLKHYRVAALLTQEELAARAQLSADTVRALERGKRRVPRLDSVRLLADALALTGEDRQALLAAARQPATTPRVGDEAMRPLSAHDLAIQPTPFLGREGELQTIYERLTGAMDNGNHRVERARLLTLTGPAGVGKTRLALAAAARLAGDFTGGVVLVDLAPVRDPPLVLPTMARVLGLADSGGPPLLDRLRDVLRERSLLLVLDNFEQVLAAAGALASLLAACPDLSLLVTSRVPLRLRWEWTLRVSPLPVPDISAALPAVDILIEIPSVALFMGRARARRAEFALTESEAPLVARVVSGLDGLPLALELAAARLDALSLPMLSRRLSDRLRLLRWEAPDVPERQQSLEAAVGWSYDLLSASEQRLFRCLGVFVGHVSVLASAAVVAAVAARSHEATGNGPAIARDAVDEARILEELASLVEKSLALPIGRNNQHARLDGLGQLGDLEEDTEPDASFRMLETVREYAWEQLAAVGELKAAQRGHARYFRALAERASAHLRGPDQLRWFLRLEQEHDNLRAALRWWLDDDTHDDPESAAPHEEGLRMASSLAYFWWTRGYIVEGWRWLEEALGRAPGGDPTVRIRALLGAGAMLSYQGAYDRATVVLNEAMALAHAWDLPDEMAQAYAYLGLRAVYAAEVREGVPLLQEALRRGRELGDHHLVGLTLMYLGGALLAQDQEDQAVAVFAESLESFEMAGDGRFAGNLHIHFGWFAGQRGDVPEAVRHIRIGLEAGVAFEERRLLSVAAQAALSLLVQSDAASDLEQRMRLLGAIDALSQATGMTLLQTLMKSSLGKLREHLKGVTLEAAYREGRSLSFNAVADLARATLDRLSQAPIHSIHFPEPVSAVAYEPSNPLTLRQREVLRLVAQGLSNKAIARQLFLSASTVNYHLTAAFNTLGVSTRAQAVAVATRRGFL